MKTQVKFGTEYFLVLMVASLLVVALPLAVGLSDAILPCLPIHSFTCVRCYSLREHLRRYSFKSSLANIPLVLIVSHHHLVKLSISLSGKRLHLKKSWGIPVLFLSSVLFSLGPIVVDYHTRLPATKLGENLFFNRLIQQN